MIVRLCLTNLLTYRNVYKAVDNDANYDTLYLDFSKAFDKVPHDRLLSKVRLHGIDGEDRLLSKVRLHGIDGEVLCWIRSWLSN